MSYPGGKGASGVVQTIINQQPPHTHYIEPFLGGGSVIRAKRPAFWNTAIDLDPRPVAAFASAAPSNFTTLVDDGVQWLIDNGRKLRSDSLVYCDPPYLMAVRSSQRSIYREEFTDDDHWRLLRVLCGLGCMVQLSGYWSKLYARRLQGWRELRFQAMTRGGPREECLWMNYPEPKVLHDYSLLGNTFRERERIKRKVNRWRDRLAALPTLERIGLYSALKSTIDAFDETRPRPSPDMARAAIAPCSIAVDADAAGRIAVHGEVRSLELTSPELPV